MLGVREWRSPPPTELRANSMAGGGMNSLWKGEKDRDLYQREQWRCKKTNLRKNQMKKT
jgi:hypothetical protein